MPRHSFSKVWRKTTARRVSTAAASVESSWTASFRQRRTKTSATTAANVRCPHDSSGSRHVSCALRHGQQAKRPPSRIRWNASLRIATRAAITAPPSACALSGGLTTYVRSSKRTRSQPGTMRTKRSQGDYSMRYMARDSRVHRRVSWTTTHIRKAPAAREPS